MEKIIIATILTVMAASPIHAWEMKNNPDRFPSIGLNYSQTSLDGTIEHYDRPSFGVNNYNPGKEDKQRSLVGADIRLPMTDQLTFTLGYSRSYEYSDMEYNTEDLQHSTALKGYKMDFGVRFYINR